MPIYPDKKNGKLTGRYQVQIQRGKDRYRQRWDTLKLAQEDEKRVLALWDAGEPLTGLNDASEASLSVHSIENVIELAKGKLWVKKAAEEESWAKMEVLADMIGRKTLLDSITTTTIDRLINKLSKGRADGTVNRYLSALRTFLVWAKGRGYRTIPVEEIEFSWRKEATHRIRWITPEEEAELQDLLPSNVWKLVRCAIKMGCRRSEFLNAEPSQLNGNRFHLWETKTDNARTIPMDAQTTQDMKDLLGGEMPTLDSLRRSWARARKAMGLAGDDQFVFHTTRHTCATRMVDASINVFVIKEWMGHKRIETTLRYAHVRPENLDEALLKVGLFEAALNDNSPETAGFPAPHPLPTSAAFAPKTVQSGLRASC